MALASVSIFWFRRDLRLDDNVGLYFALKSQYPVVPIFIFDTNILSQLPQDDARVSFIYETLEKMNRKLNAIDACLQLLHGKPIDVFNSLLKQYDVKELHFNKDYEPNAIRRDEEICHLLNSKNIECLAYKDQVIFEENDITKADGLPYTVYTPYKNKWVEKFKNTKVTDYQLNELKNNFLKQKIEFQKINFIDFEKSTIKVQDFNLNKIKDYDQTRDFPALNTTSYLSPHLRFGTVSIRKMAQWASQTNPVFLSELIWREFFMQIIFHFPKSANHNFKSSYDGIQWRNNEAEFKRWCDGKTGYPMVDAGMRQLNQTGYMHNRVRMVVASFLCKHLLIDWRWGETYFAQKLLDYDLSANVGNWQWAAGTGCDAAPYFRVFNPEIQLKKFDANRTYVNQWLPELTLNYCKPMVEHALARDRAIATYKAGIKS
jgi:deoxyribodipyrimidine photo-lyase